MSASYHLHQINASFDKIFIWYREFMIRTERCFQKFNERLLSLEARQTIQPSDEQVERVLRKILAEKFGSEGRLQVPSPYEMKDGESFVTDDIKPPKPIPIEPEMLHVDPQAVPSEAWRRDFEMLSSDIQHFAQYDSSKQIKTSEAK